ncbi:MAG: small subunit ribosomal protein [Patescibacteria group bacterium]|jgi:small subunit ribosomal protein S18|nr:small subunit ribosomal protein [Patescibacteria group bacterium]
MKQDYFSSNNIKYIDYKDIELLKKFIAPNARMMGRKKTNTTSKNQRKVAEAIKRSRFMGLLPFIAK